MPLSSAAEFVGRSVQALPNRLLDGKMGPGLHGCDGAVLVSFILQVLRHHYRSRRLQGDAGLKCRSDLIEPVTLDSSQLVASWGASRHQLSKTQYDKICYEGYYVRGSYRLSLPDQVLAKAWDGGIYWSDSIGSSSRSSTTRACKSSHSARSQSLGRCNGL